MNRENAGAKPTAPPRLPPEAEQEILEALFEGMEIRKIQNKDIKIYEIVSSCLSNFCVLLYDTRELSGGEFS